MEVRKESDVVKRDLDQITQENEVTKKLLSEEKKKSEEARKVYEQKLCDYESQISNLKAESNQAKKDTEEQLAYEKETLNITLRAMEKENVEYVKELQRLSTELEEYKSQDVKITSELKVSAAKHEQTELELKNATDEVENLAAKLCMKTKELEETSNNLTRSINETEIIKKQLDKAEEELDEKTKIFKAYMRPEPGQKNRRWSPGNQHQLLQLHHPGAKSGCGGSSRRATALYDVAPGSLCRNQRPSLRHPHNRRSNHLGNNHSYPLQSRVLRSQMEPESTDPKRRKNCLSPTEPRSQYLENSLSYNRSTLLDAIRSEARGGGIATRGERRKHSVATPATNNESM